MVNLMNNKNVYAANPGVVEVGVLGKSISMDGVCAHVLAAGRSYGADSCARAAIPDSAGVPGELPWPRGCLHEPCHLPACGHYRLVHHCLLYLLEVPQFPAEIEQTK